MKETILLVKVSNAINKDGKTPYEAIRGNWKISRNRIDNGEIKFVAGLETQVKKEVVAVYSPAIWYQVVESPEMKIKRYKFEGQDAPADILEKLNKVYDHLLTRFGVGSEKAYITESQLEELIANPTVPL